MTGANDAYFLLLAASTPRAYESTAQRYAVAGLHDDDALVRRIQHLWYSVAQATQRVPEELDLALLLAGCNRLVGSTALRAQVHVLAKGETASRWISYMARRWLARRTAHRRLIEGNLQDVACA